MNQVITERQARGGLSIVAEPSKLAVAALDQYGLLGARLTLLSEAGTSVFRVDIARRSQPQTHPYLGKIDGRRFVLRVHNPGADAVQIESELVWLAALIRDTELAVPEPVPTLRGELVATVSTSSSGASQCLLLNWVEGRSIEGTHRPATMRQVGRYMAALHLHAENFTPHAGFKRPRWDWSRLFGANSVLTMPVAHRYYNHGQLAMFEQAAERIGRAMQRLGEGRNVFGLIHADLHSANYLFHKGEVRSIDFGDCGWGYYLFDIAVALSDVYRRDDFPALRAAFLRGYREVRPLSEAHEALIDTFMVAHMVDLVNWIFSWEDPFLKPWAPRFLEKSVDALKRYVGN